MKSKTNKREKVRKILKVTPLITKIKDLIFYPVLVAFFWLLLSPLWAPAPKVEIQKNDVVFEKNDSYTIMISNPSNQDIANFEFSFKFDDKYPIHSYALEELNFKSGIILRSYEDYEIKQKNGKKSIDKALTSGLRGGTDKFPSGITVALHVFVDNKYDGSRGDVFPPTLEPQLRKFSYLISYKYKPIGFISTIYLEKNKVTDFNGRKSKADVNKQYLQKFKFADGSESTLGIRTRE